MEPVVYTIMVFARCFRVCNFVGWSDSSLHRVKKNFYELFFYAL